MDSFLLISKSFRFFIIVLLMFQLAVIGAPVFGMGAHDDCCPDISGEVKPVVEESCCCGEPEKSPVSDQANDVCYLEKFRIKISLVFNRCKCTSPVEVDHFAVIKTIKTPDETVQFGVITTYNRNNNLPNLNHFKDFVRCEGTPGRPPPYIFLHSLQI
jgi:hypothetical protein